MSPAQDSPLYRVEITTTGQPALRVDGIRLHQLAEAHQGAHRAFVHVENGGVRRVSGIEDVDGFKAACEALGARTRRSARYIRVSPPSTLVTRHRYLDGLWHQMASAGRTDWASMRGEMFTQLQAAQLGA